MYTQAYRNKIYSSQFNPKIIELPPINGSKPIYEPVVKEKKNSLTILIFIAAFFLVK